MKNTMPQVPGRLNSTLDAAEHDNKANCELATDADWTNTILIK